jgi:hypothetical protein
MITKIALVNLRLAKRFHTTVVRTVAAASLAAVRATGQVSELSKLSEVAEP